MLKEYDVVENANCVMNGMLTKAADGLLEMMNDIQRLADNKFVKEIENMSEIAGKAIGAIKIIKKIYDIPSQLFMYKFERYCKGLSNIPLEKRKEYLKNSEKISRKKETLFILNVINKIEDIDKIDMTIKLLEAKLYDKIDETTYRRLLIMLGNTLYSDLIYMKNNINHENFPIKDNAQDGLLANGWIRPLGPGWGEFGEAESENLFAYNSFAKSFCKIVFASSIEVTPPNDIGTIKMITTEDIDSITGSSI